ncbi:MAG TPA: cyclase family protein [Acidimicrobiales bacterium]|nr:cyclase family protein [Acidimicrobiales bacterium]
MATTDVVPSEAEVLAYFDQLSNWGRWGPADRLGTLNHITPAKRREAARLVEEGKAISLAWEIDVHHQPEHTHAPPLRHFLTTGEGLAEADRVLPPGIRPGDRQAGALEWIGMMFHGFSVTHLDALSHIFWDRRMYNGIPSNRVSAVAGAVEHAVTEVKDGIMTRGVLVDAPRHRGVEWLEPGEAVTAAEVESILAAEGVELEPGDALLLRTGYGRRKLERGPDDVAARGRAGWQASCLPLFWRESVSLIGADTAQDVIPSGYERVRIPIHSVGMVAMGLFLLDNCDLEELAATCERVGRWTFLLQLAPLRFVGATGSPVNPIAVF